MRRRRRNRTGAGIIAVVVLILFAIISFKRIDLSQEIEKGNVVLARTQEKIDEEKERERDIAELKDYIDSPEYIEDIARNKLGLVYKDEIIFKEEDE